MTLSCTTTVLDNMSALYVVLLSLVAVTRAQLFPVGQEIVYNYQGLVQNTVEKPVLYTSQYSINALIHVKGYNNGSYVYLQDITHNSYIGKYTKIDDNVQSQDIPQEAKCLKLPFFVQYSIDGKVTNILTDKSDETWSINMKKAIASLLQLDYLQIDLTQTKPYSFVSDEHMVHGHCKLQYDILPHNKTSSTIKKWISSCKDHKWNMDFNVLTPGHCEEKFDNSLQETMYRNYDVEYSNKMFMINRVESDGSTMFYPVNGNGGAHNINVKQIMQKLKTMQLSEENIDYSNMITHSIKAELFKHNDIVGSIPDMTLGRSKTNMELLMPQMRETLKQIVDYMKESHVNLHEPDWKQSQLFYDLINHLRLYDVHSFEHCYKTVCETQSDNDLQMLDVFHEILPYVGTHASYMFIRNIIKSKKVDNVISVKLLQETPFHTMFPNEILLKELLDLTQWSTEMHQQVRYSAILSYSTLLSKTLKTHPNNMNVKSYVDHLIEQFKGCKDYQCQLVYMSALQNTGSSKVTKFLEPLIMNHKLATIKVTSHLRNLAIWACKYEHVKYPEVAYKIYWPILINKDETLEIRASALNILLETPSMNNLLKIYWYMQTDSDKHLYSIYYSSLKSLSTTVSQCYKKSSINAKRILQFIRVPSHSTYDSAVYQYDYYDPAINMGAVIKASQIGNIITHQSTALYFQFSSHLSNLMINKYAVYLKISISKNLRDTLLINSQSSKTIYDFYSSVTESNSVLVSPEDLHIEYITLKGNHIVSAKYYNNFSNIKDILLDIEYFKNNQLNNKYSIDQIVQGKAYMVTDMGLPLSVYVSLPTIQKVKLRYKYEFPKNSNLMNFKLQIDTKHWNNQMYGVNVYNPLTNVWHGSRRFLTVDAQYPFSIDMSVNMQQKSIKITTYTIDDYVTSGDVGFQSFVQSQVYNYNENIHKYEHVEKVTNGVEYRKKHVIWETDAENTGMHYKVVIFDCERAMHPVNLVQLQRQFLSNYNKNWGNQPILKTFLALRHWWAYVTLSPNPGMCGVGLLATPSVKYPCTHVDLSMRLGMDELEHEGDGTPTSKWNFRSTYNVKKDEKLTKSFDLRIIADWLGVRLSEMDLHMTTVKLGEEYKICVNGKQLWKEESILKKWTILAGNTVENKCPRDKSKIEITMKGELSPEQTKSVMTNMHSSPQCHPHNVNHPVPCMVAETALRHYEYDINHGTLPQEITNVWMHIQDWLRNQYGYYFVRSYDEEKKTSPGQMKLVLDYPLNSDDVNMHIHKSDECYSYEGIPLTNLYWTEIVRPYSTIVSQSSLMNHYMGTTFSCKVESDYYVNQFNAHKHYEVPHDWTLYSANHNVNPEWEVYVKKMEDNQPLAVQIIVGDDKMEMYHHGSKFQLKLNDKQLTPLEYGYRTDSWFDCKVLPYEQKLYLHVQSVGLNLEYNGQEVVMQIPRGIKYKGLCYSMPQV